MDIPSKGHTEGASQNSQGTTPNVTASTFVDMSLKDSKKRYRKALQPEITEQSGNYMEVTVNTGTNGG